MLLKQQAHITLKQQIKKINCFSTAFGNTFVLSIVVKPAKSQAIIHINSDGDILFRRDYQTEIGSFGMIRDKEIIVLNVKDFVIEIINLESQQIFEVTHNYILDDADQMQILTFGETKYFCILQQEGSLPGHRFKLTYYNYNTIFQDQNPISVHEQNIQGEELQGILKANNHSKVIWFNQNQAELIEFHTWDLKKEYEGKYDCISLRNSLTNTRGIPDLKITIQNIWEAKDDIYTLVCNSGHSNEQLVTQQNVINIFFVDAKQRTINQSSYSFYDEQKKRYVSDLVSQSFYLGSHSAFYMRQLHQGQNVPIYYVSHETQTIVTTDSWTPTSYYNFFISANDNSNLIMVEYDNGDVKDINVTSKKITQMKQIALHFMLHINEDFDDDLLQDGLDLLDLIE